MSTGFIIPAGMRWMGAGRSYGSSFSDAKSTGSVAVGPVGKNRRALSSPDFRHQDGSLLESMGRMDVATGTVKWSNPAKGYGFIQPDNGGNDVFVHISAVERAGLSNLNECANVSFEVVANRGKESAENLRVG